MTSDSPKIVALIPARGGSKGIPRKNILPVMGRPLIAWSIGHALQSKHIARVIVSTDDNEIARISITWGAEVPFLRPSIYAQDMSPDIEVFKHALSWLQEEEGYVPDLIVHLRPTSPVRQVNVIDSAISRMLDDPSADALRSVSLALQTPYKMWLIKGKFLEPVVTLPGIPECHSVARQQLPKVYRQNGYVDIIRSSTILEKNSMTGINVLPLVIEEPTYELDYMDDIPHVEHAIRNLLNRKGEILMPPETQDRFPV